MPHCATNFGAMGHFVDYNYLEQINKSSYSNASSSSVKPVATRMISIATP